MRKGLKLEGPALNPDVLFLALKYFLNISVAMKKNLEDFRLYRSEGLVERFTFR